MNSTLENIYQVGVDELCIQQTGQLDQQEGRNYKHIVTKYGETAQVKTKKKSHLY